MANDDNPSVPCVPSVPGASTPNESETFRAGIRDRIRGLWDPPGVESQAYYETFALFGDGIADGAGIGSVVVRDPGGHPRRYQLRLRPWVGAHGEAIAYLELQNDSAWFSWNEDMSEAKLFQDVSSFRGCLLSWGWDHEIVVAAVIRVCAQRDEGCGGMFAWGVESPHALNPHDRYRWSRSGKVPAESMGRVLSAGVGGVVELTFEFYGDHREPPKETDTLAIRVSGQFVVRVVNHRIDGDTVHVRGIREA